MKETLVLALETASPAGGVALVGEEVLGEVFLASKETYSRRLLKAARYLLEHVGLSLSDLSGVAVSLGPGSFTGLRIGLATAKGLALGAGLPLVGVPTLKALASGLSFFPGDVCPVLDARRRQVYAALYRWEEASLCEILPPSLLSPEKLVSFIERPTIFLGDGLKAYQPYWQEALGEKFQQAPALLSHPRPAAVGILGRERLLAGNTDDPHRLVPIYLRPSEAELKFGGRH